MTGLCPGSGQHATCICQDPQHSRKGRVESFRDDHGTRRIEQGFLWAFFFWRPPMCRILFHLICRNVNWILIADFPSPLRDASRGDGTGTVVARIARQIRPIRGFLACCRMKCTSCCGCCCCCCCGEAKRVVLLLLLMLREPWVGGRRFPATRAAAAIVAAVLEVMEWHALTLLLLRRMPPTRNCTAAAGRGGNVTGAQSRAEARPSRPRAMPHHSSAQGCACR